MSKREELIQEIIGVGRRLYVQGLAVAQSGNISARIDDRHILITASQTHLGSLNPEDIVKVSLEPFAAEGNKKSSSELPLHALIYKNFPVKVVVHSHAPLINGYFAVCDSLKALTFETKFYLGNIPVVPQDTPTVTKPQEVVEALKSNNIVVLKNHGSVAIADKFSEALALTESLEEAVRTAAVARLFDKDVLDDLDKALKTRLAERQKDYEMFSKEHIQAIVDLVNQDELIAQKGKELDLTVVLAIKLDGDERAYKFNFEKGRIKRLDYDSNAPFVISASCELWREVFLGKVDPFVAVTQGRMKLEGQLGMLSRWYVPFSRLFELFKQVEIA